MWERTEVTPTGATAPTTAVPLMTAPIQLKLAPNFDMDTMGFANDTGNPAHLDFHSCTPWLDLKLRNGVFKWKQTWRPKGTFNDTIFWFNTLPTTVATFKTKKFPFSHLPFTEKYINANAIIPSPVGVDDTSIFPWAARKALGIDPQNVLRIPALQIIVPGIGADDTASPANAGVYLNYDVSCKVTGSISVIGNNTGMMGTAFP